MPVTRRETREGRRAGIRYAVAVGLALATTGAVPSAPGRAAPTGDPELAACARIARPTARLACYDALARARGAAATEETASAKEGREGNGGTAKTPTAPRPADTPRGGATEKRRTTDLPTPAAAAREDDDFGLPPKPRTSQKENVREFVVARVRRNPYGEFVFEMRNGQVWKQTVAVGLPPVRPGTSVRIRRGKLGGFLMQVKGRTIRVKRIR